MHSIIAVSEAVTLASKSKTVSSTSPLGFQLEFDKGNATSSAPSPVAMSNGTIVKVKGFLYSLPVRVAEWQRNAQRVFAKAVFTIQTYALAQPGRRFRIVHGNSTILSGTGHGNPEGAFSEVFKGDLKGRLNSFKGDHDMFSWEVFCSSPKESTRKGSDRQFVFLNDRPCDMPKVRHF